jgi:hypothetical protein
MSYIPEQQTYYFTSNPLFLPDGAVSANGSRFKVNLLSSIKVPPQARGVEVLCTEFTMPHVNPNISADFPQEPANNQLHLVYNNGFNPIAYISLTLDKGNYSPSSLNLEIQTKLSQVLIPSTETLAYFSPTSIQVSANGGSQRVILSLAKELTVRVSGAVDNNVMPILGWPLTGPDLVPAFDGHIFVAPSVAQLNRVNTYLLHAPSLLGNSGGIPVNNSPQTILATMQATVPAGDLLAVEPRHPTPIQAGHLREETGNDYDFYLTDEQLRSIDTLGEFFSFKVVVRYYLYKSIPSR